MSMRPDPAYSCPLDLSATRMLPRRRGALALAVLAVRHLIRAFIRYRAAQRDYDRLLKMPDYLLRDAGLTRHAIRRARSKPFVIGGSAERWR